MIRTTLAAAVAIITLSLVLSSVEGQAQTYDEKGDRAAMEMQVDRQQRQLDEMQQRQEKFEREYEWDQRLRRFESIPPPSPSPYSYR